MTHHAPHGRKHQSLTITPTTPSGRPSSNNRIASDTWSGTRGFHQATERGGIASLRTKTNPHGGDNDPALEEYELGDYVAIRAHRDQLEKESRRTAKREEKLRWLNEQDEMKFSHSIQFNAVPDWSSQYLAYSNLKKL